MKQKYASYKLNQDQVDEIRDYLSNTKISQVVLAKKYKVHPTTINQISKGRIWPMGFVRDLR